MVVLYDGDCGLCTAAARWVTRAARPGQPVHTRASQDPGVALDYPDLGPAVTARTVVVIPGGGPEQGQRLTGARAVAAVLDELQRYRLAARLMTWPPTAPVAELGYRLVARHRHRLGPLLGLGHACELPVETAPVEGGPEARVRHRGAGAPRTERLRRPGHA